MNVSITLQPAVNLANRKSGSYGIGEIINLGVVVKPATATIASVGGIGFRVAAGKGTISNPNTANGTATFTASATAGEVRIVAYGLNNTSKELGSAGFKVVAPTSLSFKKTGNIIHTQGSADAGFHGEIRLQPPGVSYEQLSVPASTASIASTPASRASPGPKASSSGTFPGSTRSSARRTG